MLSQKHPIPFSEVTNVAAFLVQISINACECSVHIHMLLWLMVVAVHIILYYVSLSESYILRSSILINKMN